MIRNDSEYRFLGNYLNIIRDRHFPMLIPQARLGIGERRRPDFVAFIPLQKWKFRWIAIELDDAHPQSDTAKDTQRDSDLLGHGYKVFSVRRTSSLGYFEEARRLAEYIDTEMNIANHNPAEVAIEAKVTQTTPADNIPF
ncbi:hypothetical protein [Myxococcus stipitatus]|uniref:hypothetical protein n=1 Tax=Myxococcus stipitatus TaxID=83455 RepID=UPI0030CCC58A